MVGYDDQKKLQLSDSFIAGILGGIVTRVFICPIDVLKIRFQLQPEKGQGKKYNGIYQATKMILAEEGVNAFWKGHVPAQCLSMIFGGMQFGSFHYFTEVAYRCLPHKRDDHVVRATVHCACGSLAGGLATISAQPVDVLRTRFAAQKEPLLYPSLGAAVTHMLKHEGIKGFYRGTTPALMQVVPYSGLQFMSYSCLQALWRHVRFREGSFSHLICGAGAGICSKAVVYPFDVVKKRLQVQGFGEGTVSTVFKYSGVRDCLATIYRYEGATAFYKGWSVSIVKSCATSGLIFVTYEWFSDVLRTK